MAMRLSALVACATRAGVAFLDGHFTIQRRGIVSGQGSAGNVIAALGSFFIPGLGQLIQGRLLMAITHFVLAAVLWFVLLGWAIHLWSVLDAALWKPKS